METVNNGDKRLEQTVSCVHRPHAKVIYVVNSGTEPPVILILQADSPMVVTLTNQRIRVDCPECYRANPLGLSRGLPLSC